MKARVKGTNDPFKEIDCLQFKNSYVLYKADMIEFENESKGNKPDVEYWEQLRHKAAIAAMQGTITILGSGDRYAFREVVVKGYKREEKTYPKENAQFAVACADAIITELKKK